MDVSAAVTWWEVLVLGIVQGLTEYLPVSSSGHLVLTKTLLGIRPPGVALELVLHLGTLLAVVLYYRRDLLSILRGLAGFLAGRREEEEAAALDLTVLLVIGTIPAVIGALLFGDKVEAAFSDPKIVCVFLMITGLLLLSTMLVRRGTRHVRPLDALVIGLFQMCALLPGISRSGSTISGGLFRKVKPEEAARFSFLLSIPAIVGAAVFKAKELVHGAGGGEALHFVEGFVISALVGYLAIGMLLRIVRRGRFGMFGVYCLAVGAIGFVLLSGR